MKLQLGCGSNIKEGWINHDITHEKSVDIAFDLDKYPYPFADDTFEEILSEHVIEHVKDLEKHFEELYRITKHEAIINITAPHHASGNAYGDITHTQFLNAQAFKNVASKSYSNIRWKENKYTFKLDMILVTTRSRVLEPLINMFLGWYDYALCYIVRPNDIKVRYVTIKHTLHHQNL